MWLLKSTRICRRFIQVQTQYGESSLDPSPVICISKHLSCCENGNLCESNFKLDILISKQGAYRYNLSFNLCFYIFDKSIPCINSVCVCVCACVRACVCLCVCVWNRVFIHRRFDTISKSLLGACRGCVGSAHYCQLRVLQTEPMHFEGKSTWSTLCTKSRDHITFGSLLPILLMLFC